MSGSRISEVVHVLGIHYSKCFHDFTEVVLTLLFLEHMSEEALVEEEAFGQEDAGEEDREDWNGDKGPGTVGDEVSVERNGNKGRSYDDEPPEPV